MGSRLCDWGALFMDDGKVIRSCQRPAVGKFGGFCQYHIDERRQTAQAVVRHRCDTIIADTEHRPSTPVTRAVDLIRATVGERFAEYEIQRMYSPDGRINVRALERRAEELVAERRRMVGWLTADAERALDAFVAGKEERRQIKPKPQMTVSEWQSAWAGR
jgi:hypothetical protein